MFTEEDIEYALNNQALNYKVANKPNDEVKFFHAKRVIELEALIEKVRKMWQKYKSSKKWNAVGIASVMEN